MKIGVISDVHNNVKALEAILEKFEQEGCEEILCCGDLIGVGPYPEETIRRIRAVSNIKCVRGNHEKYLIEGCYVGLDRMGEEEKKHHDWEHSMLSEASKAFICSLSNILEIVRNNKKIVVVHYCMNEEGKYINFTPNPTAKDCERMFASYDADIILYGHDHKRSIVKSEEKYYINCGSLGCPHEPKGIARGGILAVEEDEIQFQQVEVGYDVHSVINRVNEIKYPAHEEIKAIFYGVQLD